MILVSREVLSSTTVFNIDNNNKKKCFLSSKSEWILKDHVTLKRNDAKKYSFTNTDWIQLSLKIENTSQYYFFQK